MQCWSQVIPKGQEILLVDLKKAWPHRHRSIAEQGEQPTAIQQEMSEQSLKLDAIKDGSIYIQGFEMDARREVGMETLGQALADCQLERDDWVLCVG